MKIKLNKNGVNSKEEDMRRIGFTDYNKERWYFSRLYTEFASDRMFSNEVGFSVAINKDNPEDLRIDVLDEDFCQPYDYQHMLEKNPSFEPALKVKEFVEEWMKFLIDKGVLSGHEHGEYI